MVILPGYEEFNLISETLNTIVYRGLKTESGDRVVIKFLRIDNPTSADIARFKHEYELIRKIDLDEVVKVLDIVFTGDRFALVMEDFGGISLKDHLQGTLPPDRFLDMAIRLTTILEKVHQDTLFTESAQP